MQPTSAKKEVIIPFGIIIDQMINGYLDINKNMTLLLDGAQNNTSRIIFHRDGDYVPRLEVFYTE